MFTFWDDKPGMTKTLWKDRTVALGILIQLASLYGSVTQTSQPVAQCTFSVFIFYPGLTSWQVGGPGLCMYFRDRFCAQLLSFLVFSHWDIWNRALGIFAGLGGGRWENKTGFQSAFTKQVILLDWMCTPKWKSVLIHICGKENESFHFQCIKGSLNKGHIEYV